jgi:flagellar biosynthesis/type III secretory pathway protein FliH
MSSSPVLRGDLHSAGGTQRVVLRSQPSAALTESAQPGVWITEQELAGLKRQWMDQAREQVQREAQEAAVQKAEADAKARLELELKTRDDKHAKDQAEKWRSLATALAGQLQSLREQLEAEVSEWTFIAATRLLGERSRDGVVPAVKHVLADAKLDGPVTVLLNAQDLAIVEAARTADATGWPAEVAFAASDRLPLGGCLVQSPTQTLDARLDVQLGLLREALDLARHQRADDEVS